ncbi:no significant blast hit [Histoplasma capsulatum var. duboisii H88]|uniref:No significant blast hit n=1 Tax=Ajellomyces capsulatus (strain H88) TaxID=544711 RepID=A0A8A1LCC3_AJEC8|nr:no significant blast hit [Histoplasma capsulatum var. duboisii H88]
MPERFRLCLHMLWTSSNLLVAWGSSSRVHGVCEPVRCRDTEKTWLSTYVLKLEISLFDHPHPGHNAGIRDYPCGGAAPFMGA